MPALWLLISACRFFGCYITPILFGYTLSCLVEAGPQLGVTNGVTQVLGNTQNSRRPHKKSHLCPAILFCTLICSQCADYTSTVADLVHTKSNLVNFCPSHVRIHVCMRSLLKSEQTNGAHLCKEFILKCSLKSLPESV